MNIRVKITRDGTNRIVTMDLEEYLRGVVASEMPSSWPIETLKAQAIAARTYAARYVKTRSKYDYDVDDTVSYQAYRENYYKDSCDEAIKATTGIVVMYGNDFAQTVYSSSNPGYTRSAKERWGNDIPYLIHQNDPYDTHGGGGHGVGMSQWGAKGAAERGLTYKEILQFYYPGTTLNNMYVETEEFPCYMKVITKNSNLNVRNEPNGSVIIGKMPKNAHCYGLSEKDNWTEILYDNGLEVIRGWSSSEYLSVY